MAAGRLSALKRRGSSKYASLEGSGCSNGHSDGSYGEELQESFNNQAAEEFASRASGSKRRKISPIALEIGEKEVRISSKNRITQVFGLNPATPSPSPPGSSCVLEGDRSVNDGHRGSDRIEESEAQGWNIGMSRWADNDELMDGEVSSSPESGEVRGDSSVGKFSRSTGSSGIDSMDDDDDFDAEQGESAHVSLTDSDDDYEGSTQVERKVNMLSSCRSVFEFEMIKKINEGTYGVVYKAKDKKTGEIVALKKVKMDVDNREGFPLSSLREMNILLSFNHPAVVDVKEVVVDDFDGVFMVMEYMEHDLKGLIEVMKQPFSIGEIKSLMWQLLRGVKYLHDNWVLHRDLKTSNILLNNKGELKICDFGMSRQYGSPLKPYTPLVVTLWYRAPELLLGSKEYSTAIDMWSVGCIMAELVAKEPLFRGKSEVEQLDKIFRTLGTPDEKIWPGLSKLPGSKANFVKQPHNMLRKKFPVTSFTGWPVLSESGFDLLNKFLTYDPEKRITAETALLHDWFREAPLPNSDFKPISPFRC